MLSVVLLLIALLTPPALASDLYGTWRQDSTSEEELCYDDGWCFAEARGYLSFAEPDLFQMTLWSRFAPGYWEWVSDGEVLDEDVPQLNTIQLVFTGTFQDDGMTVSAQISDVWALLNGEDAMVYLTEFARAAEQGGISEETLAPLLAGYRAMGDLAYWTVEIESFEEAGSYSIEGDILRITGNGETEEYRRVDSVDLPTAVAWATWGQIKAEHR